MLFLPLLAFLGTADVAQADEKEADTCLRTKIWEGYNDGWAVRTATSAKLAAGEHRIYLVTLYSGNEYRFLVCGDQNAEDIDLVIHDSNGQELGRDQSDDREPIVTYKPSKTETYYVAVYAAQLSSGAAKSQTALAVTYR